MSHSQDAHSTGDADSLVPGSDSQPVRSESFDETHVLTTSDLAERMLVQLSSLAVDVELEDAVWALVSTFAEGLDHLSIGVCTPRPGRERLVVRHSPIPAGARATDDETRLFPERTEELVSPIPGGDGATLHVASDHRLDGSTRRAAGQLAMVLASVLARASYQNKLRQDASEVPSLRDNAVQSDKLAGLGRMAASIAHELNNPLTSIVAYADHLRRKLESGGLEPSDADRVARIGEAANRVLQFTRDLVAYSRPSTADPSALSIHEVIERALVFCDHIILDTKVTVVRSYGEVPQVRGLHGPLTQVFINLITNACQAMQTEGGRLTVSTSVSDGRLIVNVADEGHGIQTEKVDELFQPYFTTRAEGGGNGLGLDIVRTIVASHGGRVTAAHHFDPTVEPKTAPIGAIFCVELPLDISAKT